MALLSSFNFDALEWKSNIPAGFFFNLVAKNRPPMKKRVELKKPWITISTSRSMHSKDKLH